MAHDEHLAARVRDILGGDIEAERKMFGALAFMAEGRMACCVSADGLLVKVGRDAFTEVVRHSDIEPMAMGDVVSDSWVKIGERALPDARALRSWIDRSLAANPPKGRS